MLKGLPGDRCDCPHWGYVFKGRLIWTFGDREEVFEAGDAFYVPTWAWHQHKNASATEPALYIACENAPMLQNLGIAVREEE